MNLGKLILTYQSLIFPPDAPQNHVFWLQNSQMLFGLESSNTIENEEQAVYLPDGMKASDAFGRIARFQVECA